MKGEFKMAGYKKGSEELRKMVIRREKEWMIFRGLLIEGYNIEQSAVIMDKSVLYLRVLFGEFSPLTDIKELV